MKQIRLCWSLTIDVIEKSQPTHATPWEPDTAPSRENLVERARAANASDGPDTYWLEERTAAAGAQSHA